MKKTIKKIFQYFSMIALGIEGLVLLVLNFAAHEIFEKAFAGMSGAMLVELVIFLIIMNINDEEFQENSLQTIQNKFDALDVTVRSINNASIEVFSNQNWFYDKLRQSRLDARESVFLTQLDPWPPSGYEQSGERQEYFKSDLEYAKNHPRVDIRRIVSIPSKEKLAWIKDWVEQMKDIPNFHLAYINLENIEKSSPFPKMLSLQIIDKEEVFLLNPQYSYMPRTYAKCIYMKNKEVGEVFTEYYLEIWKKLAMCEDLNIGGMLKSGIVIMDENIAAIERSL